MRLTRFLPLLLFFGLLACQKQTDALRPDGSTIPEPPTTTPASPGVVYEKGKPVGQAVHKTIGPEGGTLTSADGTLSITVPPRAVTQATVFTVQPVTPTLPGLLGQQAYRLLPEKQTFAQPVTLRYQYQADSLAGTSAQLLFMCYQGSDGYWKALPNTELDETAHKLTVSTKHFSDWGAFAEFVLKSDRNVVAPGESAKLSLEGFTFISPDLSGEEIEIPLARIAVLADPNNIKNWQVKGVGHLTVEASRTLATYTAPANATGGSALVSVDVYNFIPPNLRPRKGATGKAVILTSILIDGRYFQVTVDGQTYNLHPYGLVGQGGIVFGGSFSNNKVVNVQIRSKNVASLRTVAYGTLYKDVEETAFVDLSDGSGWPWFAWYPTCEGDQVPSSGGIHIESYTTVNGKHLVRGSLTATLYGSPDNCINVKAKKLSAKFNILLEDR